MPSTDDELFNHLRNELFTAVVGDIMDQLGYRNQFLPADIRPLQPQLKLVGRAMPVLEADVFDDGDRGSVGPLASKPFGLMLEALDDLKRGEIYVATGSSLNYAMWGELMSMRAGHLGASGAVVDGFIRDSGGIEALGFPTFSRGLYAQDQGPRGKVIDFRCRLEIGGVAITPGALLFGDREGVLTIPREAEDEVVRLALEKARAENTVARAIKEGMSARDAFEKYGVM